jgi:hypothetical protein
LNRRERAPARYNLRQISQPEDPLNEKDNPENGRCQLEKFEGSVSFSVEILECVIDFGEVGACPHPCPLSLRERGNLRLRRLGRLKKCITVCRGRGLRSLSYPKKNQPKWIHYQFESWT